MIDVWQQRGEPLGLLVGVEPSGAVHTQVGDRAHRFSVRNRSLPLVMVLHPHQSWRVPVSLLAIGSRVAICIPEEDDVPRVAKRLLVHGTAHLADCQTALWDGDVWRSTELQALV